MIEYDSYLHLIRQLDELVAVFEEHPDPATREQVISLLGGLDMLHREGLRRFVDRLRDFGGEALLQQAAADPIVEVMLGLYDLVDLDLPEERQEAMPQGFVPLEQVTTLDGSPEVQDDERE